MPLLLPLNKINRISTIIIQQIAPGLNSFQAQNAVFCNFVRMHKNIIAKDDDFEEPISWLQEEYDDLKSSVEIVSSFSQMLNRIGKDNVIIFCFD